MPNIGSVWPTFSGQANFGPQVRPEWTKRGNLLAAPRAPDTVCCMCHHTERRPVTHREHPLDCSSRGPHVFLHRFEPHASVQSKLRPRQPPRVLHGTVPHAAKPHSKTQGCTPLPRCRNGFPPWPSFGQEGSTWAKCCPSMDVLDKSSPISVITSPNLAELSSTEIESDNWPERKNTNSLCSSCMGWPMFASRGGT